VNTGRTRVIELFQRPRILIFHLLSSYSLCSPSNILATLICAFLGGLESFAAGVPQNALKLGVSLACGTDTHKWRARCRPRGQPHSVG